MQTRDTIAPKLPHDHQRFKAILYCFIHGWRRAFEVANGKEGRSAGFLNRELRGSP
jgi:hypothetical protein